MYMTKQIADGKRSKVIKDGYGIDFPNKQLDNQSNPLLVDMQNSALKN